NYEFSKYWMLSPSFVLRTGLDLGYGDSYGSETTRDLCVPVDGVTADPCTPGAPGYQRTVSASGLPFFENFYAGGTRSVRGFRDNTLGPRSEIVAGYRRGQALGGSLKTVGQVELVFPRLFDSNAARVSAFVDFGNVYNGIDDFDSGEPRASAGVALLWRPPLGPLSISYALPLRKQGRARLGLRRLRQRLQRHRRLRQRRAACLGRRGPAVARAGGPDLDQLRAPVPQAGRRRAGAAAVHLRRRILTAPPGGHARRAPRGALRVSGPCWQAPAPRPRTGRSPDKAAGRIRDDTPAGPHAPCRIAAPRCTFLPRKRFACPGYGWRNVP